MTDLDRYLTEEVAEKAARAEWEHEWPERSWGRAPLDIQDFYVSVARAALSAVLPDIIQQAKAEAWDEGHRMSDLNWRHIYDGHPCDEGETCPTCCQPNPYRAVLTEQGVRP